MVLSIYLLTLKIEYQGTEWYFFSSAVTTNLNEGFQYVFLVFYKLPKIYALCRHSLLKVESTLSDPRAFQIRNSRRINELDNNRNKQYLTYFAGSIQTGNQNTRVKSKFNSFFYRSAFKIKGISCSPRWPLASFYPLFSLTCAMPIQQVSAYREHAGRV